MVISRTVLLRMRNALDEICGENQNTHFMFNTFFWKSYVCEILWKNLPDRAQMIWHMRIACWKTETTVCNTAFPHQSLKSLLSLRSVKTCPTQDRVVKCHKPINRLGPGGSEAKQTSVIQVCYRLKKFLSVKVSVVRWETLLDYAHVATDRWVKKHNQRVCE